MATGSDIAKAGWLFRQSSVLHRWKKNWFVLYRDGDLKYFDSPNDPRAEERIVVRAWVQAIRTGPDCRKVDPPEGNSQLKSCLFELIMQSKDSLLLCAESFDDMRAWQIALDEARTLPAVNQNSATTVHVPGPGMVPYTSPFNPQPYPGYVYNTGQTTVIPGPNGSNTTVVMPPAPQTQQVVYVDNDYYPYRRRRYYRDGFYMGPLFWW